MLIDRQVNLHAPQFAEDKDAVIARAREAGIALMVTICDKVSAFEAVHAIAMAEPDIWCTVGTHPHESKEDPDLTAARLVELLGLADRGGLIRAGLAPYTTQGELERLVAAVSALARSVR